VAGASVHPRQEAARRSETGQNGQHPFATVLTCSDSRVPPEVLFDQGIGDVFVVRVAGNVASTDEIGSIEYGADHLGTPLVVVLAHTKCGAVTAVVKDEHLTPNIAKLVAPIVPAVKGVKARFSTSDTDEIISKSIEANMWQAIADMFAKSPVIKKLAAEGKIKVIALCTMWIPAGLVVRRASFQKMCLPNRLRFTGFLGGGPISGRFLFPRTVRQRVGWRSAKRSLPWNRCARPVHGLFSGRRHGRDHPRSGRSGGWPGRVARGVSTAHPGCRGGQGNPLPPLIGFLAEHGAGAEAASLPSCAWLWKPGPGRAAGLRLPGQDRGGTAFCPGARHPRQCRQPGRACADSRPGRDLGHGPSVGLRINPQVGLGGIRATSVAGTYSKFGVPLARCREICDAFARYHG
jgi:carbonic anhydrase